MTVIAPLQTCALEAIEARVMRSWLREILVSLSVAVITLSTFAVAIAVGLLVSIEIDSSSWWVGATASIAFLLFVVLPLRLWWVMKNARGL
jgi:hypothetical protein